VIPLEALIDGAWYSGRGRSAPIDCWEGVTRTFHTVQQSSWADPASYPAISRRTVRLKQEKHVATPGGTFAPLTQVPQKEAENRKNRWGEESRRPINTKGRLVAGCPGPCSGEEAVDFAS